MKSCCHPIILSAYTGRSLYLSDTLNHIPQRMSRYTRNIHSNRKGISAGFGEFVIKKCGDSPGCDGYALDFYRHLPLALSWPSYTFPVDSVWPACRSYALFFEHVFRFSSVRSGSSGILHRKSRHDKFRTPNFGSFLRSSC